jgi:hypothetical protein
MNRSHFIDGLRRIEKNWIIFSVTCMKTPPIANVVSVVSVGGEVMLFVIITVSMIARNVMGRENWIERIN